MSFTLTRDSLVSVAVRRAGRPAVVARRAWRAGAGTAWSALRGAIGYRNLAPGRYTLTARAARGSTRVTAKPLGFTVAR